MIRADFQNDWRESLEQEMAEYGSSYDPSSSLKDSTITYLNAKRRAVPPRKRTLRESKELQIPEKHSGDYRLLKKLISEAAI
jgi:hypothetical protein